MNLSVSKKTIFVLAFLLSVILLIKVIVNTDTLIHIFLVSFIIHTLIALYFVYTNYEMNFLHEKQGSKLILSTNKLNTNIMN